MKFKKNEKVLWHGKPAIIYNTMTKNPLNGKSVKWYEVKYDLKDFASHLVSEDAGTLTKLREE